MNNQVRPYEPLTSENAALVLVDHQVGLMSGVRDISTGELKHNVVGLAKAAKLHKLRVIVTTTARDGMWGPTFPEVEIDSLAQRIRGEILAKDGVIVAPLLIGAWARHAG
jgi:nicotinamidase-related amidase